MDPCMTPLPPSPAAAPTNPLDLSLFYDDLTSMDLQRGVDTYCSGSEAFRKRLFARFRGLGRGTPVTKLDLSNLKPAKGELETIKLEKLLKICAIDPSEITHLSLANNDLDEFPYWGPWPFPNLRELDVRGNPLKHLPILFLKIESLRHVLTKGTHMKLHSYDDPMINSKTFVNQRKRVTYVPPEAPRQGLYNMCVWMIEAANVNPASISPDFLNEQLRSFYRCGICEIGCIPPRSPEQANMTRWAPELSMQLHVGTDDIEIPEGEFKGAVANNSVTLKGKLCRACWKTVMGLGYTRAQPPANAQALTYGDPRSYPYL